MSIPEALFVFGKICLASFAALLPFSIAGSNIAWLSSLGFFLLAWLAKPVRPSYNPTGLEWPWFVYIGISALASALSADPSRSFTKLWSDVLILIVVIASQRQTPKDASRNMRILMWCVSAAALWGCFQYLLQINWISTEQVFQTPEWASSWPEGLKKLLALWNHRAVGFYNHPLTYAEVLLLGWPIAVALCLFGTTSERRLSWVACALMLFGIAFSGTRGVWLSVTGSTVLWLLMSRERRLVIVLAAIFLVFGVTVTSSPLLRSRAVNLSSVRADSSNTVRLGLWDASLKKIRTNPWLGVGIGNVRILPEELRWGGSRPDMIWTEVHNIYLQMAVERGLLGLAAFLWFLIAMGKIFWRLTKSDGPPWARGLFYGWVGLLLAGMTESWTHDSEVILVFYFIVGSACAVVNPGRQSSERTFS